MTKFLFALFLLISFVGFSQQDLRVRFVSQSTLKPVMAINCVLYQEDLLYSTAQTDSIGVITFENLPEGIYFLVVIDSRFESVRKRITLNSNSLQVEFDVRLLPITYQEISEVTVKAPGVVDTVFGNDKWHVQDFEVLKNGDLVILAYQKNQRKGSELILFNGIRILQSIPLVGISKSLVLDYRGVVHVVSETGLASFIPTSVGFQLAQVPKEYFYKYIAPIIDTVQMSLYFSNFDKNYPEFDYYRFNREDSTYFKIRTIKDDLMMELYRSEYKWVDVRTKLWAKNLENETGIDAEIWVGANYFTRSIYYKSLYAPIFQADQLWYIFDYYTNNLFVHSLEGTELANYALTHHLGKKDTGFQHLLQDPSNQKVYAYYEKSGKSYVGRVNLPGGTVNNLNELNFRYIEKVLIYGNQIYYIYRPFESTQKRFLYRERIGEI